MQFAVLREVLVSEFVEESKFDNEVTAIMLIIVLLAMRVKLKFDEVIDGIEILAHNAQVEGVVALPVDMVHVGITSLEYLISYLELVLEDCSLEWCQVFVIFKVNQSWEPLAQDTHHGPFLKHTC